MQANFYRFCPTKIAGNCRKVKELRKLQLVAGLWLLSVSMGAAAETDRTFEFRGLTVASKAEQHRDMLQKCAAYLNAQGCKLKNQEVAGVLAFPEAMFRDSDGTLEEIRGSVSRLSYATLLEGFTAKWGKPDQHQESEFQNGYGAKIVIPTSVWEFSEGRMTLTGPDFRGNGVWHFRTHARQAYLDGLRAPKRDF